MFLVIIILLTKWTYFRKFFILPISQSSAFLRSNLNTYIVFQSFRTVLLLNTSEVSVFTKGLCILAILRITALNLQKSNVKRNLFQYIFQKIEDVLRTLIFIFFVFVRCQFNAFCINSFFTVIVAMILALVFIVFTALFLNMFVKLYYIIGIFTHFSVINCISFLRIIFRNFFHFMFGCLFFLVFASLSCVCVNLFKCFLFVY